jgi:hypothetical protein
MRKFLFPIHLFCAAPGLNADERKVRLLLKLRNVIELRFYIGSDYESRNRRNPFPTLTTLRTGSTETVEAQFSELALC